MLIYLYKKMSVIPPLLREYFEIQDRLQTEYNCENIVLLMQVGSFYEVYETEEPQRGKAVEISKRLRIHLTKKNGKLPPSNSNPYMCGIPCYALGKHLYRLVSDGYSVAVCDQDPANPKKRSVRGVYNKTVLPLDTTDDCETDTHTDEVPLIGCSIERYKCVFEKKMKTIVSVAVLFPKSGRILVDEDLFDDDWIRYIQTIITRYESEHLLLMVHGIGQKELTDRLVKTCPWDITCVPTPKRDDAWIDHVLSKSFGGDDEKDIRNVLTLDKHPYVCDVIAACVDFFQSHGIALQLRSSRPEWINSTTHRMAYNKDALLELGVRTCPRRYEKKNMCLVDMLNKTSTPSGYRRLLQRVLHPSFCSEELERRYDAIDRMCQRGTDKIKTFHASIGSMPDMERMLQQWSQSKLTLTKCYVFVTNLRLMTSLEFLQDDIDKDRLDCFFHDFLENMHAEYGEDRMWHCKKTEVAMHDTITTFNNIHFEVTRLLEECSATVGIQWIRHDSDGLCFQTTKKKWETIAKTNPRLVDECLVLSQAASAFRFVPIRVHQMKIRLKEIEDTIRGSDTEHFKQFSRDVFDRYGKMLYELISTVAHHDVDASLALVVEENGYTRPTIGNETINVFRAEGLRHPIIEAIDPDTLYVPVTLEMEKTGILLYGINSSGKSTVMKSIGLAFWMAQIGMFVAAESFTFLPRDMIMTKFLACDNMYKGQSTFVAEMLELKYIMKRCTKNSLVMFDELTAGTEIRSAFGVVVSSIFAFHQQNIPFLISTHIHEIAKVVDIQKCATMKHFELNTDHGNKQILLSDDIRLRFDRCLREGSGVSEYGIEIARYVGMPPSFIECAFRYREKMSIHISENEQPIGLRRSKYNKKLIMDKCRLCESKHDLHTHHIIPQKNFGKNKIGGGYKKDAMYNIVVLCRHCHEELHKQGTPHDHSASIET